MQIFEAIVIRINDIPTENSSFSQKEIIVVPYASDRETVAEYIAIPPSLFPTDQFGSGITTLPELNQRCLVAETAGFRRVQIVSYLPFPGANSYGEYSPTAVTSGGASFKVGGAKPITMYFHKGGRWELFSNEFCKLELDGTKKSLAWTVDSEQRTFAGGRVINSLEEIDGTAKSTQHVEVYTRQLEWKQNSDIRVGTERSVLNPESSIMIRPDYSYVPKVIIKAGTITNNFDRDLGKILGHIYQIETRQSSFSGDKDTVSKLKLGRQSEMYKFENDNVYPAGDMFEWSSKESKITSDSSSVSTHLLRYGQLEKDVKANGASVEYVEGEVFRNQSYINIIEPLGAPLINVLAEGKGYELEWSRNGTEQQYLTSYGRLTSENLVGNSNFLHKSAAREHFHAFDDFNAESMTNPKGILYDFVLFGDDGVENNIFLRKFSRMIAENQNFFHKEQFTETKYIFELDGPNHSAHEYLDAQKYTSFVHITENRALELNFEQNLYKNYVKLDSTHEKTENFTTSTHEMTIKLDSQTFLVKFIENSVEISLTTSDTAHSPSIKMSNAGFEINPGSGNMDSGNIKIGGGAGLQELATKAFIETIFKNHIHPTTSPGAPTLIPIPITIPNTPDSPLNTYTEQIRGE